MSDLNAIIDVAAAGDNVIVPAPGPGYAIRVLMFVLSMQSTAGAIIPRWKSGTGGGAVNLTGPFYGPGSTGQSQTVGIGPMAGIGRALFQCQPNQPLNLNMNNNTPTGGFVVYEIVAQ
jgi:hypothetical protein